MNSSSSRTALVTGATGFVGSFLVDRLLQEGWHVVALARGRQAAHRVGAALHHVRGELDPTLPLPEGLRVIAGDVRDPSLGLTEFETESLSREIDEVWHCAANFGGGASGETPFSVNVTGTHHLLAFATRCNRSKPVPFFYVSTAFAGDNRTGVAFEEPPPPDGEARNDYESSKREAERLVLHWREANAFPAAIFRPSIILGHARTGRAAGFAAYYDFLRSLRRFARFAQLQMKLDGLAPALRVQTPPDLRVNFVTIDFVIDAMWHLARISRGDEAIFNLVNEEPVAAGPVIDVMCRSLGLTGVELVEPAAFSVRPMTRAERTFHSMIGFERPYLEHEIRFDNRRFRRLVPIAILPAPRIDASLLRRINRSYLDFCERESAQGRPESAIPALPPDSVPSAVI